MIVIIACAAVVVLVLVLIARFFWRKLRVEQERAEAIRKTQANLGKMKTKAMPIGGEFNPDPNANLNDKTAQLPMMGDDMMEEQYDPNQEFRIFGIGDKTKGGIQTLQQKMNMADEVDSG